MENNTGSFLFSVVMSVYQVKNYMGKAIDSLINQTIGFDHIQLILVDDGSSDGSAEICDEYKEKYPQQVIVIHKENGGLSSARNAGLPYVKGKYVSFFDPDDMLRPEVFQKVFEFMEQHEEVDICTIPVYFIGGKKGAHSLNYRFKPGTRVVDLSREENADNIQLCAASSFFRRLALQDTVFDSCLFHAEDAKEILKILMKNPQIGLVADTCYYYRKRSDSITSQIKTQPAAYCDYLHCFSEWALDTAQEKFGTIPRYIQKTVMYDLQAKIRQAKLPDSVLTPEEKQEYKKILFSVIRRIDDEVILQQKNLKKIQKIFLLCKKYGHIPEYRPVQDPDDMELCFEGKSVLKISDMNTTLEFFSLNAEMKTCTIEGYFYVYGGMENMDIIPCFIVNGVNYPCEIIDRSNIVSQSMDEDIAWRKGFRALLPINDGGMSIYPAVKIGQTIIQRKPILFEQFFPVSKMYDHMRAYFADYMLKAIEGGLFLSRRPGWWNRTKNEIGMLREIWQKNKTGKKMIVGARLYYHIVKPFKVRKTWLISDRIMKADDNGEALFCYLMKNKPRKTRVFFVINKDCEDAKRIAAIGPCVGSFSRRHLLLHLLCDTFISTQASPLNVNPFCEKHNALRDLLIHQKYVYLQHGITQNDVSGWLSRYAKNIAGFVAAAIPEYHSLLGKQYGYYDGQVWLTGFPRFDRLYHQEEKKITLMPTWRRYLMRKVDRKKEKRTPGQGFYNSEYYQFYNALLNSDRLLTALEKNGYQLQLYPHPNLQISGIRFEPDPRVNYLPIQTPYRDIYAQSNLVITDYSSAAFDFAYLRKPIIYCQFDKESFFAGDHICKTGYFNYERDGFGEVTYDLESTIDQIIDYVEHGCTLKDEYRRRIDGFFAFNDQDNCKRVTEKILNMISGTN